MLKKVLLISILLFSFYVAAAPVLVPFTYIASFISGVSDFFDKIGDGIYDLFHDEPDWDTLTLDELLIVVTDEDVFTDKRLDEMAIDRDTFLYLLNKVKDFNERVVVKSAVVELNYDWVYLDESLFFTEEVMERIAELHELGKPQEAEALIYSLLEQMQGSAISWQTFSFSDMVSKDYPLDWQCLYLFASYIAVSFSEDESDWIVSRDCIDTAFEYIAPDVVYDDNLLNPAYGDMVHISMSDLASFRITTPYDLETDNGVLWQHYYGALPCMTVTKVDTLLCTCHIDYYYDPVTGKVKYDVTYRDNYLKMLDEAGEALCRGFEFEVFIEQLRMLPGGNSLADTFLCYDAERGV